MFLSGILLSLYGFHPVRVGLQKVHEVSPRPWWRRLLVRKKG
jgi:hypothetical protein